MRLGIAVGRWMVTSMRIALSDCFPPQVLDRRQGAVAQPRAVREQSRSRARLGPSRAIREQGRANGPRGDKPLAQELSLLAQARRPQTSCWFSHACFPL